MSRPQPPRRRLERAGVLLQEAADELEAALGALPSPQAAGAADVQDAIGTIMETLRLLNDAYRHIETRDTLRLLGGGR